MGAGEYHLKRGGWQCTEFEIDHVRRFFRSRVEMALPFTRTVLALLLPSKVHTCIGTVLMYYPTLLHLCLIACVLHFIHFNQGVLCLFPLAQVEKPFTEYDSKYVVFPNSVKWRFDISRIPSPSPSVPMSGPVHVIGR